MMVIAGEIIILASALCSCTAGITGGLAQGALGSLIVVYGAGGWMVLAFGMSICCGNQAS